MTSHTTSFSQWEYTLSALCVTLFIARIILNMLTTQGAPQSHLLISILQDKNWQPIKIKQDKNMPIKIGQTKIMPVKIRREIKQPVTVGIATVHSKHSRIATDHSQFSRIATDQSQSSIMSRELSTMI